MNDFFKLAEKIARDWGAKNPIPYPDASHFYTPPFITCCWCNFMTFLDVISFNATSVVNKRYAKILDEVKLLEAGAHIPKESLLPCKKCGRSDAFFIGPLNFADIIADRRRAEEEKRRRRDAAVLVLQRAYRAYLRRVYGSSYSLAYVAHKRLLNKASSRMQALVRGRFARRQAKTERCLRVIQFAHPLLLKHALKGNQTRSSCFWYNRQADVDYLFRDYTDFIEKMGNLPARMFVELNIKEISVRIIARQAELLTLIQRAWRGVMGRRMVKIFKSEMIRLFQVNISRIMKIQRTYRAHYARLQVVKVVADRKREAYLNDYLKSSGAKMAKDSRRAMHMQSLTYYKKERKEETTARTTSRLMPMEVYENRKLAAFEDSSYFDVRCTISNNMVASQEQQAMFERNEDIANELARREFILARREEHGPRGYGLRGFKPVVDLQANTTNGFVSKDIVMESKRSKSFRIYFEKELKQILDNMIERADHTFKRGGNKGLYKEYNGEKPIHILLRPIEKKEMLIIEESKSSKRKTMVEKGSTENKIEEKKPGSRADSRGSKTRSAGFDTANSLQLFQEKHNQELISKLDHSDSDITNMEEKERLAKFHGFTEKVKGVKSPQFATGKEKLQFRNNRRNHKYCEFKYPKDINVDPLAWLEEDLDILVKFKAQKQEDQRAVMKAAQDNEIMNRVIKK